MFTGIVEEMGKIVRVEKGAKSSRLTVSGDKIFSDLKLGDSVATNGVCLTVTSFSKGIFSWVGFDTKWLEYENVERAAGQTKWSFWKLFKYSLEGITAFSAVPLAISSFLGILFCIVSFIMICVFILKTLIWGDPVAGYPSLVCIIFFIGGVQLFCVGVLGQYVSKTYLETKKRPLYIVKESDAQEEKRQKP